MAFISKTDVVKKIRPEELGQITRTDDTIIYYGIDVAIDEMRSYLSKYFDIDVIFQQTGNARNQLLLDFGIDIAIYTIVAAALPGQDLEDRRKRYDRAIDWLKRALKDEISTTLQKKAPQDDDSPNNRGSIGAHNKRNNYF